jgi:quercetin dioxygenase-like cupin family protein
MVSRRILIGGLGGLLGNALQAQGLSKVVFKHDLPDLTLKDWAVTAMEVSYGPGERSPAHRHPGITIVYVLEGEIGSKVGDGPEKTYTAGEMFLETPQELHAISRNASSTRPAKLLAILLAGKGVPLTTPAAD